MSSPRALRPERESPSRGGRHRGHSDTGLSRLGQLVHPAAYRSRARVAPESRATPRALGTVCESPGTAGHHRGPSDNGLSRPGELVDTQGNRRQARILPDSWSTPQALGPERDSPGTSRQPSRIYDPGPRTRGSWSTPSAQGHGPESPGTAGRPRGPSAPSLSCPGQLVDNAGPQTKARVIRYS